MSGGTVTSNFNSNVVRLKVSFSNANHQLRLYFNSNVVRLKGIFKVSFRFLLKFQFQCGAIKRWYFLGSKKMYQHFNSNVVRLKESYNAPNTSLYKFQFQCGAIKRRVCRACIGEVKRISIPMWCD